MAATTWLATTSRVRLVRLAADTTDESYLVRAGDMPPRLGSSDGQSWVPARRHVSYARLAGRVNLIYERQFDSVVAWGSRSASGGCLRSR